MARAAVTVASATARAAAIGANRIIQAPETAGNAKGAGWSWLASTHQFGVSMPDLRQFVVEQIVTAT
jgi:hypothetical protein